MAHSAALTNPCFNRNSAIMTGLLPKFWAILPVLWVACILTCYGAEYCYVRTPSWTAKSQVRLSLFISFREFKDGKCGEILPEALQNYVAVAWIIDKLNGGFIPGIKFDFQVYDDCQSSLYAARNALDLLGPSLPSTIINCTETNPSFHLGILGPSRSATATEVARLLETSRIPMVSSSATVADLSDKAKYPTFFRTALSDTVQIKPVLEILKKLDWTYVVVVHSDDIYGQTAAKMLKSQGRATGICFVKSLQVSYNTDRSTLFADLLDTKEKTQDGTLGVVYFGMWGIAENILDYYNRNWQENKGLFWLMSESIGQMYNVFKNKDNAIKGTITLSPAAVEFEDLKTFWFTKMKDNKIVEEYLQQPGGDDKLLDAPQSDYLASTIDAVYCKETAGLCSDLETHLRNKGILDDIKTVSVNYTALDPQFVPAEYVNQDRYFRFKDTGDIHRGSDSVMYQVNSFSGDDTKKFINVGNYSTNGLNLDKTAIQMKDGTKLLSGEQLPKSICYKYCKECVEFGQVPMVFLEGDVYLVGVFSIHEPDPKDPFKCSKFRSVSSDTIALEAFLYAVKDMQFRTGIKFGAIAFDDCYSPVRLTSIISEYFSAVGKPWDVFTHLISLNETVGVIGSLSSGSTIPLARFFSSLNIPTISYAASSPDLDDRVNFPNFLRTVPSDVEQAQAMVALIQEMGWEFVSLLYVNNNYGTKGMQKFRELAQKAGICVTQPKNVSESANDAVDSEMYGVLNELIKEDAKVVVFFGIDTRFEKFVQIVNEDGQYGKFIIIGSEDWGNKQNILNAGQRATRGALTLQIEPIIATPFANFESTLLKKTPDPFDSNPWFEEFWQYQFQCNIRGGFNNIFDKQCSPDYRLTEENMKNHLENQRVSHVQYAVYAAAEGAKKAKELLCSNPGAKFPCPFFYSTQYAHEVWEAIREVKNPKLESFMFDNNGNGAIGFKIYNVQVVDSKLSYVEVGSFGGRGLELEKNKLEFYNQLGYKTTISARCGVDNPCSMCDIPSTPVPPSTLPPPGLDDRFRIADIVLIVIIVLLIVLLITVIILGCRYLRSKVTGLSKEIQKCAVRDNDHIYQAVSERRVYQNEQARVTSRMTSPTTPNHIYFVNGSSDNLTDVGGHVNLGYKSDDTMSQRNVSGGTFQSAGVAVPSDSSQTQTSSDNTSTSPRNITQSPAHSGSVVITDVTKRPLPPIGPAESQINGRIPNGIITSPIMQRPSTLQFHQNPRFVDMGQVSVVNPQSMNQFSAQPDLQQMPISYIGSPLSSLSPASEFRHQVQASVGSPVSPPPAPLSSHSSPSMAIDPSILAEHANIQAILEQQAAYNAALELQRLQALQQQNTPNSPVYTHLSSAETRPVDQSLALRAQGSPEEIRPRPRTNPNHVPSNLNRFMSHHGSIDSLRSSGGSNKPVLRAQGSMENIPETIPMQSLGHDSRISRV